MYKTGIYKEFNEDFFRKRVNIVNFRTLFIYSNRFFILEITAILKDGLHNLIYRPSFRCCPPATS